MDKEQRRRNFKDTLKASLSEFDQMEEEHELKLKDLRVSMEAEAVQLERKYQKVKFENRDLIEEVRRLKAELATLQSVNGGRSSTAHARPSTGCHVRAITTIPAKRVQKRALTAIDKMPPQKKATIGSLHSDHAPSPEIESTYSARSVKKGELRGSQLAVETMPIVKGCLKSANSDKDLERTGRNFARRTPANAVKTSTANAQQDIKLLPRKLCPKCGKSLSINSIKSHMKACQVASESESESGKEQDDKPSAKAALVLNAEQADHVPTTTAALPEHASSLGLSVSSDSDTSEMSSGLDHETGAANDHKTESTPEPDI